jgi:hypothetical protein
MIAIVICINCAIAILCLGVAWFLIKLKARLVNVTRTLEAVERQTHAILYPAPPAILTGQQVVKRSRIGYQNLEPQWQKVAQMLSLLNGFLAIRAKPVKMWKRGRKNPTRRN